MKHKLTAQQAAIVSHKKGPALVFAVAGSGKTTSMIRRIEFLVREGVHPANKILATSFSKATVTDIQEALTQIGVRGVKAMTLHSLGFKIIRKASERGYISSEFVALQDNQEFLNEILVRKAVRQLSRQMKASVEELNLDPEDLKNQISAWKGNFIKANGISEMGEFKWETVQAFIAFARQYGNSEQLLQVIYRIAQGYKSFDREPGEDWLKIMTVYRAKGLEWNTVFIPECIRQVAAGGL